MGFTIKEKAFLLDYFRTRVKQENEDWPYFVPPYTLWGHSPSSICLFELQR
jgi:hypothetical protein